MFKIQKAICKKEIEPLCHPFQFKGDSLTCLWQTIVYLESDTCQALGLGVQSVLWSDSALFTRYGETDSNRLMFEVTRYALQAVEGKDFETPMALIDYVFPLCYSYCQSIVDMEMVSKTFILNALVPLDHAAWMLYAKENKMVRFDHVVGETFLLTDQAESLSNISLITYNTPLTDIARLADQGCCVFKIKIGSDPDKDGSLDKMLEWDKRRIEEIHRILKDRTTAHTRDGRLYYYLDANGRYDIKDRLMQLVAYLKEIGAFDRVLLLEEPFCEGSPIDVGDVGLCIAADESIHDPSDVETYIALGYGAITLKPIAKTLSRTLQMMKAALKKGAFCFCADLTVNPVMVEWSKNLAARLPLHSQLNVGIMESNGAQNYINWEKMKTYHPFAEADFTKLNHSIYHLNDAFYAHSGGIFELPKHYLNLIFKEDER